MQDGLSGPVGPTEQRNPFSNQFEMGLPQRNATV
jgi:hypothetical protein